MHSQPHHLTQNTHIAQSTQSTNTKYTQKWNQQLLIPFVVAFKLPHSWKLEPTKHNFELCVQKKIMENNNQNQGIEKQMGVKNQKTSWKRHDLQMNT